MQKIVRVKLSVEAYAREQFHTQMPPPAQCPRCGWLHRLWAHGYYERYSTGSAGKPIAFSVRRFRCTCCGVTISCLPCFAQPYRLVSHTTLEAFVKGRHRRVDGKPSRNFCSATCAVSPTGSRNCCGSSGIGSDALRPKKTPPPSGEERWRGAGRQAS